MTSPKTFLYFGYGSNLLAQRIHVQNPSAKRKAAAKLLDYRLDFNRYENRWGGCAATIVPDPGQHVWGAVWEINKSNLADLDRQEGVADNVYKPLNVTVTSLMNETLDCRVYQLVDVPSPYDSPEKLPKERRPSRIYLETILQGAVESGLPEDYINFLKSFPHNGYTGPIDIPGMDIAFRLTEDKSMMKYILVTGGVISGVGKGVIASSFGTILSHCGIKVTSIKIDPYINIDAGTFSPYEHGEVYVLDDGSEVDLDLGNYERFLDITLHGDNNITTGKIYQYVINKERKGDYLGKTVQVVPHITDAIQEWIERVAHQPVSDDFEVGVPEVCIIELGGTIGDIEGMPFIEAFRQFQFRAKIENFCCVHVSLVPQPKATGEAKTKPTQSSVRELRGLGLSPDMIVCRSEKPIGQDVKDKISNFCHVPSKQVICIHDLSSIYQVPLLMESQGIVPFFHQRLQLNIKLPLPRKFMSKWKNLAKRIDGFREVVNIAIVGKYTKLEDAYASVTKALQHAATAAGYRLEISFVEATALEEITKTGEPVQYHQAWEKLCKSDGVVVPGGFGRRGVEGKISACKWCRENQKPFLGICLGLQIAVIEYARNVLMIKDANSTEFDSNTSQPVVIDMPEHNQGQMGGTMRLGKRETVFQSGTSVIRQLYGGKSSIQERHRHRYEVNPEYVPKLEEKGLRFVGQDATGVRMQILELENHAYFVATQFHPEYLSRPLNPSPPFMGLILAAVGKLKAFLSSGFQSSCENHVEEESDLTEEEEWLE